MRDRRFAALNQVASDGATSGARIDGEMLVDADTGLVLSIGVRPRHSVYGVRRELVQVAAPEPRVAAAVTKL